MDKLFFSTSQVKMKIFSIRVVIFLLAIAYITTGKTFNGEDMSTMDHVAKLVHQLLNQHLTSCRIVLMAANPHAPVLSLIYK